MPSPTPRSQGAAISYERGTLVRTMRPRLRVRESVYYFLIHSQDSRARSTPFENNQLGFAPGQIPTGVPLMSEVPLYQTDATPYRPYLDDSTILCVPTSLESGYSTHSRPIPTRPVGRNRPPARTKRTRPLFRPCETDTTVYRPYPDDWTCCTVCTRPSCCFRVERLFWFIFILFHFFLIIYLVSSLFDDSFWFISF